MKLYHELNNLLTYYLSVSSENNRIFDMSLLIFVVSLLRNATYMCIYIFSSVYIWKNLEIEHR